MDATTGSPRGRRGTLAAAAVTVALTVAGASAVVAGLPLGPSGPPQPAAAEVAVPVERPAASAVSPAPTGEGASTAAPAVRAAPDAQDLAVPTMSRSAPVRLAIPSIGVSTGTLVELGKQADGSLEVPRDPAQAGWFRDGAAPGQFGPAVLAGHVDGNSEPGVFYRLGELRAGASVLVTRADGSTAEFVVDKVERYPKDAFPTVAVYSDTNHRSELRLITCGGDFDAGTGHYVDNVVAYAHLV